MTCRPPALPPPPSEPRGRAAISIPARPAGPAGWAPDAARRDPPPARHVPRDDDDAYFSTGDRDAGPKLGSLMGMMA